MGYDLPTGKREHPSKHIKKCIQMAVEQRSYLMLLVREVLMTPFN
jgi:hypothetical protein